MLYLYKYLLRTIRKVGDGRWGGLWGGEWVTGVGGTYLMHSRSLKTTDARTPAMSGRSTSGFHRRGKHRVGGGGQQNEALVITPRPKTFHIHMHTSSFSISFFSLFRKETGDVYGEGGERGGGGWGGASA